MYAKNETKYVGDRYNMTYTKISHYYFEKKTLHSMIAYDKNLYAQELHILICTKNINLLRTKNDTINYVKI